MTSPELIDAIAELAGILPEYYDILGRRHIASTGAKEAALKAMGIEISEESLLLLKNRKWLNFIEPVNVIAEGEPINVLIHFPLSKGDEGRTFIKWFIKDEEGRTFDGTGSIRVSDSAEISGRQYVRADFAINKNLSIGYYDLEVFLDAPDDSLRGASRLIIVPKMCHQIANRLWGLSLSLYGLKSKRNWAFGDIEDLKEILTGTARLGAGFVGINPLHSIQNQRPYGTSPYSPISRLYRNFLYISTDRVPEFEKTEMVSSRRLKNKISALKKPSLLNYEEVAELKLNALRQCFTLFYETHYKKKTERGLSFEAYCQNEGIMLKSYAAYEALARQMGGVYDFRKWPEKYSSFSAPAVTEFISENTHEILFWSYVQWVLDSQIKDAHEKASAEGMPLGIYQDLAVATIKGGHEVWLWPEVFANGISLGAPPDDFNPRGQDWGLTAFAPLKLRQARYEPFIQTLRHNLRYAGALRIDHALGLFRLFWIPEGFTAEDGIYVRCPYEELLGIIALESVRAKTVIIAEDLGTVTDEAKEGLRRFGLLSYRVFYFERKWPERDFLPPERYPEMALATVTTHDLPTIYGFWAGKDIEVKRALSLYPSDELRELDEKQRALDKKLMLDILKDYLPEGFSPGEEMTPELCSAVYAFLASTPSKLISVSLDDVLGITDQQNMPGTVEGHPNWLRRYPIDVAEIPSDSRLIALSVIFRGAGRAFRQ